MRATQIIATLAELLRVLGDGTRLRILDALSHDELCVCDLAMSLGASQSTVSHSLRALRQTRLVKYRKDGKIAYYSLSDERVRSLLRVAFAHVHDPDAKENVTGRSRRSMRRGPS